MPDLSPAAEAVLNAVTLKRYDVPFQACPASIDQIKADAAAVLWAAAYKVVPARSVLSSCCEHNEQAIRHKLLAIAAELKSLND